MKRYPTLNHKPETAPALRPADILGSLKAALDFKGPHYEVCLGLG